MGGRWFRRPLGLALAAPLAACLQSPPNDGGPACGGQDDVAQIALGRDHACARLENGGVWCWGLNDQGQLGDGTRIDHGSPSQVVGLREVVHLAVGQDHSCALREDGSMWCWGSGSNGQLGDGGIDDALEPVEAGLADVTHAALGDDFSCAVTGDGDVHCWGENEHGQAGPDFAEIQPAPARIEVGGRALGVIAGDNHACALLASREVACWGGAEFGQLGDDTLAERGSAAPVANLTDVQQLISGANHTCAVRGAGALWCWGSNESGQLAIAGDNPADSCASSDEIPVSCLPVEVEAVGSVAAVAGGVHHTCVVAADGAVRCVGGNQAGQLGNGSFDDSDTPVDVQIEPAIDAIAAGEAQTCAISEDRDIYCWGSNRAGQLAEVGALVITEPAVVANAAGALEVAAGAQHTCIRRADGLLCWGANDSGQLGDMSLEAQSTPVEVLAHTGQSRELAPGEEHTCLVSGILRSRCWGSNSNSELGPDASSDDYQLDAVTVVVGGDVLTMDAGDEHACAVRTDNLLYCWGSDAEGQLGNGEPSTAGPVEVPLGGVVDVAGGDEHTCAVVAGGTVHCWGSNEGGQLGDGSTTPRDAPAEEGLALLADQIAVGDDFSCALSDGAVWCWGDNEFGQLGDGTIDQRLSPIRVIQLPAAETIALGAEHACAIVSDGGGEPSARCWGRNDGGQLGNGTTESSPVPVAVSLPGEVKQITAGARHTCALVAAGATDEVYCWGSDVDGRIGSGRPLYYRTASGPIDVCR